MALSMQSYLAQMNKQFLYRATWLPHRKIEVGQIGKFHNHKWVVEGNLSDFDIEVVASSAYQEGDLEFSSQSGVSISTKLNGASSQAFQHLLDADAGIAIEFKNENAIVFKAHNITHHQLQNKIALKAKVLDLWKRGLWDKDYLLVSEVLEAESATILVSNGAGAKIELKATGDIGGEMLDIANADLGLQAVSDKNIGVKIVAKSNITPLYNVLGIRKSLFGNADLAPRNIESLFVEVPFGEE